MYLLNGVSPGRHFIRKSRANEARSCIIKVPGEGFLPGGMLLRIFVDKKMLKILVTDVPPERCVPWETYTRNLGEKLAHGESCGEYILMRYLQFSSKRQCVRPFPMGISALKKIIEVHVLSINLWIWLAVPNGRHAKCVMQSVYGMSESNLLFTHQIPVTSFWYCNFLGNTDAGERERRNGFLDCEEKSGKTGRVGLQEHSLWVCILICYNAT